MLCFACVCCCMLRYVVVCNGTQTWHPSVDDHDRSADDPFRHNALDGNDHERQLSICHSSLTEFRRQIALLSICKKTRTKQTESRTAVTCSSCECSASVRRQRLKRPSPLARPGGQVQCTTTQGERFLKLGALCIKVSRQADASVRTWNNQHLHVPPPKFRERLFSSDRLCDASRSVVLRAEDVTGRPQHRGTEGLKCR